MNTVIDNLNVVTGWSGSGGASIHGLNQIPELIAGENTASIIFKFTAEDSYVEKTYSEDVTDYDELIIHVWSREKTYSDYLTTDNFYYKIEVGTGNEYYMPTFPGFNHFVIDISSITTLDTIKITALHDDTDYLIMSYMVAATDELPLDIFNGIQEGLEERRDDLDSYLLGTASATTGDTSIDLTDLDYINDYSVIKIDNGVESEIHMLRRHNEGVFTFTDLYDGTAMLNDFAAANVYLYFPVEYGRDTSEAIIPGITIWGFEPERIPRSFEVQDILDTWTDTGASERREGHYLSWPIFLDCEARQDEILAHLSRIVRTFIGRKYLYINGRKFQIDFKSSPVESRPSEHFDIIPKITYTGVVEIWEDLWQRTSLVKATTIDLEITIQ